MALRDLLRNVRSRAAEVAADVLVPKSIRPAIDAVRRALPEETKSRARQIASGVGHTLAPVVSNPVTRTTRDVIRAPYRLGSEVLAPALLREANKQSEIEAQLRAENKPVRAAIVPFTRPGGALAKFGLDIARAVPRAVTSIGLEPAAGITSLATKRDVPAVYTPESRFERAVFGEAPVKGIFEQQKNTQATLNSLTGAKRGGAGDLASGLVSAPLVAGMTALDLIPAGAPEKAAGKDILEKVAKEGVENLAKRSVGKAS